MWPALGMCTAFHLPHDMWVLLKAPISQSCSLPSFSSQAFSPHCLMGLYSFATDNNNLFIYLSIFSRNDLHLATFPTWECSVLGEIKANAIHQSFRIPPTGQMRQTQFLRNKVCSVPPRARYPQQEHRLSSLRQPLHLGGVWGKAKLKLYKVLLSC